MRIANSLTWTLLCIVPLVACRETPPPARTESAAASLMTVQYEDVPDFIEVPGSVQPRQRILLSSQINGFVREVRVLAGENVRRGQLLVTLDSREAESRKAAAEAARQEVTAALEEARKSARAAESMRDSARAADELSESTLRRYRTLFESKSVSPQELDEIKARREAAAADLAARETMVLAARDRLRQVEARITQAEAHSRQADVMVGWSALEAPVAGRVAERRIDPGTAVFPGTPLLTLETISGLQALASIPTSQAGYLRTGLEVRVSRSGRDSEVVGQVSEIVPDADPAVHAVRFKVDLPSDSGATSGEFVKVRIAAGTRRALLVPRSAVRSTGQLTSVFVADSSSRARLRLLKLLPYSPEQFEVLSGLEEGDKLVVEPGPAVREGAVLEVRP